MDQFSGAITQAETNSQFRYTQGTASFSAAAISNNVTAYGTEGADQRYDIQQTMAGDRTQASVLVGGGQRPGTERRGHGRGQQRRGDQ